MIRANDVSISSCKIIIFILLMLAVVVATATTLELSTIRNHRVCHHLAFSTRVGERKQSHFSPSTLSNTINYRIIRGHQHHKNNIISSPKFLSISSMKMSHNTSPIQKKFKLSQVILDRNDDDDTDKQLVQDDSVDDGDDDVGLPTLLQNIDDDNDEDTTNPVDNLPKGIPDGFSIIDHRTIPKSGFTTLQLENALSLESISRMKLSTMDVTVPVALLLLFPEQFATYTKARKESRRNKILVARGPTSPSGQEGGGVEVPNFDRDNLFVGKVADRVHPGDTIAIQTRMSPNYSECRNHDSAPPFELPVVYEDDHFAIVNKPEGIVVFSHKNGGYGRNSVKACLPWVLTPPKAGLVNVMRRPCPVHRIDRGTSGLLVCAKTKPAMVELSRMFRERKVKKTYTAVVNGNILETTESSITPNDAKKLGVVIDDGGLANDSTSWQLIDEDIEGQSAVTIWRTLHRMPLENARNNTVSLVELKPLTGRYHQLRRHMAWVSNCPLLGDKTYDGGGLAIQLRENGFYLCSNRVAIEHPYYNTPHGQSEWAAVRESLLGEKDFANAKITEEDDGTVWIHCMIDLPTKFYDFCVHTT